MTVPVEALRALEPRQAAAWLRANGWELVGTRPEHTATWRKSAGAEGDFRIELPLNPTFRDYARRMGEIIDTLVVASGKPPAWLLEELRASTFDIVRLRLTGPSVGYGLVPVELGANMFGLTRELLLAAACSAHDPQPVYRARKPSEAMDFLRRVQLGPPSAGSFIVTLYVPLSADGHRLVNNEHEGKSPTFERRATLTLASAVSAALQAAEQASSGAGTNGFVEGTAAGISANLCDALAGFVDGDETTGLDLQFAWAPSRHVPAGTPTAVHLDAGLNPILRQGARLLRDTATTPDFVLDGEVVNLRSNDAGKGGVAVVAGRVHGKLYKVRLLLDTHDYALAIRAHKDRRPLHCVGDLLRNGSQYAMVGVRYIVVVADED